MSGGGNRKADDAIDIDTFARTKSRKVSAKQIAALTDFATFEGLNNPYLVSFRMAVATLRQSRAELIQTAIGLLSEKGEELGSADLCEGAVRRMAQCATKFRDMADIAEMAEFRLMACAAAAALDGEAKKKPKARRASVKT